MRCYKNRKYIVNMPKIAIIEDDLALQLMYKTKLELEGFKVKTASNGEEGLKVVESHTPDVVLLDLRMPVMSGYEMLAQLRQTDWGSDIRVIILTNISKNEAPSALRFLNVDRYIVKAHTTPGEVAKIIREVIGASKVP
jgi:two-component system response regulator MprA